MRLLRISVVFFRFKNVLWINLLFLITIQMLSSPSVLFLFLNFEHIFSVLFRIIQNKNSLRINNSRVCDVMMHTKLIFCWNEKKVNAHKQMNKYAQKTKTYISTRLCSLFNTHARTLFSKFIYFNHTDAFVSVCSVINFNCEFFYDLHTFKFFGTHV